MLMLLFALTWRNCLLHFAVICAIEIEFHKDLEERIS